MPERPGGPSGSVLSHCSDGSDGHWPPLERPFSYTSRVATDEDSPGNLNRISRARTSRSADASLARPEGSRARGHIPNPDIIARVGFELGIDVFGAHCTQLPSVGPMHGYHATCEVVIENDRTSRERLPCAFCAIKECLRIISDRVGVSSRARRRPVPPSVVSTSSRHARRAPTTTTCRGTAA